MTEPAAHQPDSAYCLTEEDRDGTPYICTQKAGHHPRPHKMVKRADMSDKMRDAFTARDTATLAEVNTNQPLNQRATVASIGAQILGPGAVETTATREITKTDTDGRGGNDLAYRDLIKIVNTAETLRFEGQTTIELYSLIDQARRVLDQARAQEGERQPVDAAIIRQLPDIARRLQTQVEGWTLQRGLNRTEEAGS